MDFENTECDTDGNIVTDAIIPAVAGALAASAIVVVWYKADEKVINATKRGLKKIKIPRRKK